jgi:acetoin utilization deacetylase AcuC-like enzyme
MKKVGFVFSEEYLRHDTGAGHPERPDRLRAIVQHLKETGIWQNLLHISSSPAPLDSIIAVHPQYYVRTIERRCLAGEEILDDGDTHVGRNSYGVAVLAAGGVLRGIDYVLDGTCNSVFCAVRPPGHHAETAKVMGFCLFNNVAIGALYARRKFGLSRVAILDWDVHHGNGTQEIFWTDPSALYISLHQFPLWPGTGRLDETGDGAGKGYTINCPMKPGSGELEYVQAFEQRILPALHHFRPELLMISAGFDAHADDPLANICLTDHSFGIMTKFGLDIASKYCNGRIVSVLEGGYNLGALARSVGEHLNVLESA